MMRPYNVAHSAPKDEFISHLGKCRQHYLNEMRMSSRDVEMERCRFNWTHRYPQADIRSHEKDCPDQYTLAATLMKRDRPLSPDHENSGSTGSESPPPARELNERNRSKSPATCDYKLRRVSISPTPRSDVEIRELKFPTNLGLSKIELSNSPPLTRGTFEGRPKCRQIPDFRKLGTSRSPPPTRDISETRRDFPQTRTFREGRRSRSPPRTRDFSGRLESGLQIRMRTSRSPPPTRGISERRQDFPGSHPFRERGASKSSSPEIEIITHITAHRDVSERRQTCRQIPDYRQIGTSRSSSQISDVSDRRQNVRQIPDFRGKGSTKSPSPTRDVLERRVNCRKIPDFRQRGSSNSNSASPTHDIPDRRQNFQQAPDFSERRTWKSPSPTRGMPDRSQNFPDTGRSTQNFPRNFRGNNFRGRGFRNFGQPQYDNRKYQIKINTNNISNTNVKDPNLVQDLAEDWDVCTKETSSYDPNAIATIPVKKEPLPGDLEFDLKRKRRPFSRGGRGRGRGRFYRQTYPRSHEDFPKNLAGPISGESVGPTPNNDDYNSEEQYYAVSPYSGGHEPPLPQDSTLYPGQVDPFHEGQSYYSQLENPLYDEGRKRLRKSSNGETSNSRSSGSSPDGSSSRRRRRSGSMCFYYRRDGDSTYFNSDPEDEWDIDVSPPITSLSASAKRQEPGEIETITLSPSASLPPEVTASEETEKVPGNESEPEEILSFLWDDDDDIVSTTIAEQLKKNESEVEVISFDWEEI